MYTKSEVKKMIADLEANRAEKGILKTDLCRTLKITLQTYRNWCADRTRPSLKTLRLIKSLTESIKNA